MPGTLSPALAELAVRFGLAVPFAEASELLALATGTTVSASTIQRLTEAAGAAWCQLELELVETLEAAALDPDHPDVVVPETVPATPTTVLGLSVDGAMVPLVGGEWTEARTLVVGQVAATGMTALSYASHVRDAATFQRRALAELTRRGIPDAAHVVAVTDGAVWIQEFLDWHCPRAVRVLDFPHAAGYLAPAAQAAFGPGTVETSEWFTTQRHELRHGDPDRVLAALAALPPSEARDDARRYLTTRRAMLDYAAFADAGLPIGSGCVESANKVVIEARLKGAGMHWTRDHADAMVALRAVTASGRWGCAWPRIVAQREQDRRDRAARRRRDRAAPPPAPTVVRPKLVVDGIPSDDHPWKQAPATRSPRATPRHTKT